jgi:hypothetical protein
MKTGVEQPQSFNLSIIQSGIIESENHPINESTNQEGIGATQQRKLARKSSSFASAGRR